MASAPRELRRPRQVLPQPLGAEAYAPYGRVIAAAPGVSAGAAANQGTARRWDRIAPVENLRLGSATLNLSVFRCEPRLAWPLDLALLEKHPGSTQVFVPMNARRYLVVVALGGSEPDRDTLAAFVATGAQGVSYAPGVWHHPMIALEHAIDFTCLVHEDGTPGDCVIWPWPDDDPVQILLPLEAST
jgi:ureidoglycolate lyase